MISRWGLPLTCTVVLALAGCGASSPPGSDVTPTEAGPTQTTPAPDEPASTPTTAAAVAPADELAAAADTLACTGWVQSPDAAPFTDRWGTCDLGGSRVQLYLVSSDDAYAGFLDAVAAWGVTEASLVRVGSVVAAPSDQAQLDQIRAALGG